MTTSAMYMTVYELEKSFIFCIAVEITDHIYFMIHV